MLSQKQEKHLKAVLQILAPSTLSRKIFPTWPLQSLVSPVLTATSMAVAFYLQAGKAGVQLKRVAFCIDKPALMNRTELRRKRPIQPILVRHPSKVCPLDGKTDILGISRYMARIWVSMHFTKQESRSLLENGRRAGTNELYKLHCRYDMSKQTGEFLYREALVEFWFIPHSRGV